MKSQSFPVTSGGFTAGLLVASVILALVPNARSQGSGTGCVPAPAGLVGWWQAEGNANDSAGGNNGSITGTLRFVPGEVGLGFEFDGATSAITVPASPNLTVQSLTIEAWVFPYDVRTPRPIVEFAGTTGPGYVQLWYGLKAAPGGAIGATGALYGAFRDPGGAALQVSTAAGAIPSNEWSHVALTFDASTRTSLLYVNGLNVASNTSSVAISPNTSVPVNLGYRPSGSSELLAGTRHLGGLDEVSIYNRALSAAEILSIYNADDAGKCPIAVAPTISSQPASETISVGGTATFNVTATGSQPLSYQWRFNGGDLTGQTGSLLVLSNVQPANGGNYSVLVSNMVSSVVSSNAVLTVVTGQTNCIPPPSGLVGWWRGEGNASDSAGTNNGVLVNGAGFAPGEVGQSFVFTNLDQSVQIPDAPALDPTNGLSLEAWVRLSNYPNNNGVIVVTKDIYNVTPPQYEIAIYQTGSNSLFQIALGVTPSAGVVLFGTTPLQTNTWYHVAVTYDMADLRLYVNGQPETSMSVTGSVVTTTGTLKFGGYGFGPWTLPGQIDEVSLYNRPLSSSEVQALYSAGSAGKCVPPPSACVPPPSGLVGWWRGEGNGNDSAGTNNGIVMNSVYFEPGEVGQCFHFVSGPNPRVYVPDNPTLLLPNSLTMEAWIKVNFGYWIVNRGDDVIDEIPYGMTLVGVTDTHLKFMISASPNSHAVLETAPLPTNVWLHIAGTLDDASGDMRIYVNGQIVAETNTSIRAVCPLTGANPSLCIGNAAGSAGFPFDGWIDEVALYSRALSQAEIQAIYNAGSAGKCVTATAPSITSQPASQTTSVGGMATFNVTATGSPPLSYQWQFNGSNLVSQTSSSLVLSNVQVANGGNYSVLVSNVAGSVLSSNALLTVVPPSTNCVPPPSGLVSWWRAEGNAKDSADSNDGVLLDGTTFGAGEVGQAFSFDGVSNSVRVAAATDLDVGLGAGLTLEAWVKPSDSGNGHPIIEWSPDVVTGLYGVHFWVGHPSRAPGYFYANLADTNGNWHVIDSVPGLIQSNVFQHVAVTYDKASGLARLFLNGAVVKETNLGVFTPQTSCNVYFGKRPPGDVNSRFFAGLIDEISVYNRALGTNEIQAIYNASTAGKCVGAIAPTITVPPASQTVSLGSTALFSVVAAGSPPLSYQWRFNGGDLTGQTGSSLMLSNVQPANGGNYSVLVSNIAGFALSSNAVLTVVTGQTNCVPPPSELVGWWRGEGNANDSAGTNNGVLINSVYIEPGLVGQCFHFVSGPNPRIRVPDGPALQLTNSLTIEGWIKANLGWWLLNRADDEIGDVPYGLGFDGALHLRFIIHGTPNDFLQLDAPQPIPTNVWLHVAATLDATTGTARIYINGQVVAETNTTLHPMGVLAGPNAGLGIGNAAGTAGFPFDGWIDEISLYSRALSQTEIQAIYQAGSAGKCTTATAPSISSQPASQTISVGGTATFNVTASGSQPLSYQWRFNGSNLMSQTSSSLVLSDVQAANGGNYSVLVSNAVGSVLSSNALLTVVPASTNCVTPPAGLVSWWRAEGNAGDAVGTNDGILLDGTTFATGEVGQAFALDGLSDAVRIPASTSLNVGLGTGLTLEAWVKPFNAGHGPVMEWSRNPGGAPYGVHLWIGHPSRAAGYFYANIADTNGNWHVIDSDPGLIQTNVFQHVAVTYDKTTGTARLFLNGTVVRELNLGIFTPQTSYDLYLGERPPGDVNSGLFAGLIDEPSVYSRALSPAEIQSVYAAGGAGKCTAKLALRACNVNAGTVQNQSLRIAGQDLVALGSPSGPPPELDSVSSSSTNGAAVSLITNCVVYVPPANYIGPDRFTYTMNDGSGAAASGYVLVQVRPADIISGSKLPVAANLTGFRVTFAGSPGHSYILQRAPSVIGPWSSVGTVTIGSDGLGNFTDMALPTGSAFYRAVSQ